MIELCGLPAGVTKKYRLDENSLPKLVPCITEIRPMAEASQITRSSVQTWRTKAQMSGRELGRSSAGDHKPVDVSTCTAAQANWCPGLLAKLRPPDFPAGRRHDSSAQRSLEEEGLHPSFPIRSGGGGGIEGVLTPGLLARLFGTRHGETLISPGQGGPNMRRTACETGQNLAVLPGNPISKVFQCDSPFSQSGASRRVAWIKMRVENLAGLISRSVVSFRRI